MSEDLVFYVCCFFSCFLGGFVSNAIFCVFNYYCLRKTEEERLWNFGMKGLKYIGESICQWTDGVQKKEENQNYSTVKNPTPNELDGLYLMSKRIKNEQIKKK